MNWMSVATGIPVRPPDTRYLATGGGFGSGSSSSFGAGRACSVAQPYSPFADHGKTMGLQWYWICFQVAEVSSSVCGECNCSAAHRFSPPAATNDSAMVMQH